MRFEKRDTVSKKMIVAVPVLSIVIGLIFAGLFIALSGKDPLEVY